MKRASLIGLSVVGLVIANAMAFSSIAGEQDAGRQRAIALGVVAHAALEYQMRRGALPRDVNDLRADGKSLLPADWSLEGSLYFYERAGKPWLSWHEVDTAAACSLDDATRARCIHD